MPFLYIWQADLTTDHPNWPLAEAVLSPDERTRQARLRTPALRQTYGRAHAFMRAVLSQHSGQPAPALRFATDHHGKPTLLDSQLNFNISYRPGRALLAVADGGPVGADIERIQPIKDAQPLIAELFSATEQAALQAATRADYWPLFYLIWTRKEAVAKAQGMGLRLPFASFSVLKLGAAGQLLLTQPAGMQLSSFGDAEYQAAVALRGAAGVVPQHFTYTP